MSGAARFYIGGREVTAEPYHYKMCGLDDIYLLNGFTRNPPPYGGVAIENAGELHKQIGVYLIVERKALNKKEVRFLRKEMEITQDELGDCLGVTGQTVARYEKGETEIPGPVDRLIRLVYAYHLMPKAERAKFLEEVMSAQEEMAEVDETSTTPVFFRATSSGGWAEARTS